MPCDVWKARDLTDDHIGMVVKNFNIKRGS
jgi:hypothetical protein